MADLSWVDKLKVVELRKELRSRGVTGTGKKAELADRLKQLLLSTGGKDTAQITTPVPTPGTEGTTLDATTKPKQPAAAAVEPNKETADAMKTPVAEEEKVLAADPIEASRAVADTSGKDGIQPLGDTNESEVKVPSELDPSEKNEGAGKASKGAGAEKEHKSMQDEHMDVDKDTPIDTDQEAQVDKVADVIHEPEEPGTKGTGIAGLGEDMGIEDILAEDVDVDFDLGITPSTGRKLGEDGHRKETPEGYEQKDFEGRQVCEGAPEDEATRKVQESNRQDATREDTIVGSVVHKSERESRGASHKAPLQHGASEMDEDEGDIGRATFEQRAGYLPRADLQGKEEVDGQNERGTEEMGREQLASAHAAEVGDTRKRKLDTHGPDAGQENPSARSQAEDRIQGLKRQRVPSSETQAQVEHRIMGREPIPAPGKPAAKGKEDQGEGLQAPVPPPEQMSPALRIDNFVRPFTEALAKEMLSTHGTILDMWMPSIKTHCYVIYENEEQALATYKATYKLEWPKNGGRPLMPKFVSLNEAEHEIEAGRARQSMGRGSGSAELPTMGLTSDPRFAESNAGRQQWAGNNVHDAAGHGPQGRDTTHGIIPIGQRGPLEPGRQLTLEDLFNKTRAKPAIFWLPLTEDQIAEKKRRRTEEGHSRKEGNGGVEMRSDGGNVRQPRSVAADGNGSMRQGRGRDFGPPGVMRRSDSRGYRGDGRHHDGFRRQRR